MLRTTDLEMQWVPNEQSGNSLRFEACKGGYFSTNDEFGLKVVGKTEQNGTPTPDSPLPIQCVKAGTKVTVCGKNLIDKTNIYLGGYSGGAPFLHSKNPSSISFPRTPAGTSYGLCYIVECVADVTYTLSITDRPSDIMRFGMTEYATIDDATNVNNKLGYVGIWSESKPDSFTYTAKSDGILVVIIASPYKSTLVYTITGDEKIQLELNSTATPYEPFVSGGEITTPCDLYEGDIWYPMSGKVERNEFSAVTITADDRMYMNPTNKAIDVFEKAANCAPSGDYKGALCTIAKYRWAYWGDGFYVTQPNTLSFGCKIGAKFDTIESFKEYLTEQYNAGTPVQVVYRLVTPAIEQYDPQPIFAPSGVVNVLQTPTDLTADISATMLVHR